MKYILLIGCLALSPSFLHADESPAAPVAAPSPAGEAEGFTGKVVETISTAGYTYVQVDTGSKKLWAAATEFPVKVGDTVTVAAGAPMSNYHSKTLNRTFDLVYFTGSITVGGPAATDAAPSLPPGHPPISGASATAPALPPGHPPLTGQAAMPAVELTGIKPATGGKTIAEIFAAAKGLSGKPVTVRGKVVKYNGAILDKNWVHIQDGTGKPGDKNNDLTVTTSSTTKVGDTVLVTGKLSLNRDFGGGYKYAVMIEEAKVTVE